MEKRRARLRRRVRGASPSPSSCTAAAAATVSRRRRASFGSTTVLVALATLLFLLPHAAVLSTAESTGGSPSTTTMTTSAATTPGKVNAGTITTVPSSTTTTTSTTDGEGENGGDDDDDDKEEVVDLDEIEQQVEPGMTTQTDALAMDAYDDEDYGNDDYDEDGIEEEYEEGGGGAWDHVEMGPADAILGIAQAYRECEDPNKVNVCVGAYRDDNGRPWILPSVRRAEKLLLRRRIGGGGGWRLGRRGEENDAIKKKEEDHEYLPIEGDAEFIRHALEFAYGSSDGGDGDDASPCIEDIPGTVAGVQTISGTGACRVGGQFLSKFLPHLTKQKNQVSKGTYFASLFGMSKPKQATIYIPEPTWGNHWKIFNECGLKTKPYRYYDRATNSLDIDGMLDDIGDDDRVKNGCAVLFHPCAHNPTGCDPTPEQWEAVADVMERKGHVAFFDSAYQGFASGDADRDARSLRSFVRRGTIPVLLAQSFAKNFGLYGERCGTLSVVCSDAGERDRVLSQLRNIVRPMYSSPPKHGSSIVRTVLSDAKLAEQYRRDCARMSGRIRSMRNELVARLVEAGSRHDWSHITDQIGMFAYTGMTADMCDELTERYSIYLTRDGRISLAGLNRKNIRYVAGAIHDVTDGKSITSSTSTTTSTTSSTTQGDVEEDDDEFYDAVEPEQQQQGGVPGQEKGDERF